MTIDRETCAALLPRPLSPEMAALQQRLFMEAIQPLQDYKLKLYSLYLPTLILDQQGNLIKAAYPDEMLKLVEKVDEMIEQYARSVASRKASDGR